MSAELLVGVDFYWPSWGSQIIVVRRCCWWSVGRSVGRPVGEAELLQRRGWLEFGRLDAACELREQQQQNARSPLAALCAASKLHRKSTAAATPTASCASLALQSRAFHGRRAMRSLASNVRVCHARQHRSPGPSVQPSAYQSVSLAGANLMDLRA